MADERITILTGNDLVTGDVAWWTGTAWSRHVDDAAALNDDGPTLAAREEAAGRVVSAYVIDATREPCGHVRPAHIKDRIRARGPTVRLDLSLHPDTLAPGDPAIAGWIA